MSCLCAPVWTNSTQFRSQSMDGLTRAKVRSLAGLAKWIAVSGDLTTTVCVAMEAHDYITNVILHMAHQTTRHHGHTGTAPQRTDGTHGGIHTNRSYPISQTLFERTKRDKQWMMKLEDCKIDNRVPRFRLPFCKNSKHFHFRFSDWRGYWRQNFTFLTNSVQDA